MAKYSLFALLSFLTISASSLNNSAPVSPSNPDRVTSLPGQPPEPPITQFSGYVTVEPGHGRALFYWFFEAQSMPSQKPLLLWLNGGPGCSSIGYGAGSELGPLRVDTNGTSLLFNKYAWNQGNLLFVESPVGVGFSYTNTSSDLSVIDDAFVAEDTYNFLVNWMQRFPEYKARDFYIAGESYAGHYVPQLAELIYDQNNDTNRTIINLKGFIVGNPETDNQYDDKGLLEYAWSHAVISDQLYDKAKSVCDFKLDNWSEECIQAMSTIYSTYREIDIYNIYAPACLISGSSGFTDIEVNKYGTRRMRIPGGYDPCYSAYAQDYFNRPDVQSALHAGRGIGTVKWETCNNFIFAKYNFTVSSVLPIYSKLIEGSLKMWVYSGDIDGRVPVIGSRYCMESLGNPIKSPWRSWFHNRQVGGRIVEYKGVTLVTVRGAGHLVPLNKPSEALALINSFLTGEKLPDRRI